MGRTPLQNSSIIKGKIDSVTDIPLKIINLLGEGGSGFVYLCQNNKEESGKYYAVKEIYPKELDFVLIRKDNGELCFRQGFESDIIFNWYKNNLRKEADLCIKATQSRNLNNNDPQFLMACLGMFEANNTLYAYYDTYDGINLDAYIKEHRKTNEDYLKTILAVLAVVAKKLHCVHTSAYPILHLDLSPSNIFLTQHGNEIVDPTNGFSAYMLDFGSAYDVSNPTAIDNHRYSVTDGFSAPELYARGQEISVGYYVTAETDTYSLVSILFYALHGKKYDEDCLLGFENWEDEFAKYPKGQDLIAIIKKGLSSQGSRYKTADELANRLLQVRGELLQNGNVDLTPILDRMMKLEYTLRDFGEKLVEVKVIQMDQGETLKHIVSKLTDAQSEEINNRLIRIHQLLESESWDEAISRCSQVLDKVPENLTAHLYMLLAELKVDDVTKIDYHNTELKNDHTLNWLKEHTEGALFDVIDNIPPAGFTNIKSIVYKFSQAQDYMANTKDMVCVLNELLTDVFGIHILLRRENYNKNYRIYIPSDLNFETIDNLDELAHFFTYLNVIDFSVSCKHSDFSVSNHILYSKNGDILYKCPNNIIIERIDSTVSKISNYAFCDCYLLTTLKIPDSVNELGIGCFSGCESLITTNIPKGVEIISDFCFSRCKSLKNIDLHEDIVEIGEGAFTDCSSLTKIIVPANVRHIGNIAFSDCKSLKKVVLNEGLASIGDDSFYGCSALEPINIPTSVKEIKHASFEYTNRVEEEASYNGYSPLESAGNPNDVDVLTVGAFLGEFCANSDCSKIKKVHLPNSVSEIKERDFYGYDSLRMIYISKSVAKIERGAFKFCKFLKAIDVDPDNMFFCSINGVLYSKDMETIIYCPIASGIDVNLNLNFIKHIDDFAFCNNSSIKQIIIPEGVISVGVMAFDSCKKLKHIEFPSSLIDIGRFAFSDCDSLRHITCSKNNIDLIKKSIRPDICSKITFQIKT